MEGSSSENKITFVRYGDRSRATGSVASAPNQQEAGAMSDVALATQSGGGSYYDKRPTFVIESSRDYNDDIARRPTQLLAETLDELQREHDAIRAAVRGNKNQ